MKTSRNRSRPFYVLKNEDWTKLDTNLTLLDQDSPGTALDARSTSSCFSGWPKLTTRSSPEPTAARNDRQPDRDPVAKALKICEKALVWVEPKEPWLALVERDQATSTHAGLRPVAGTRSASRCHAISRRAPVNRGEPPPLACFQWGVLALRERRLDRAIEWLRRAAQLESNNHWYQYFLAYLEDKAHPWTRRSAITPPPSALRPNRRGSALAGPDLSGDGPVGLRSRRHEDRP